MHVLRKTILPLVAAAVAALAFGAVSAHAQAVHILPPGEEFTADQIGSGTLAVGDQEVTCNESTASGHVDGTSGSPTDTASIVDLDYDGCSASITGNVDVNVTIPDPWTLRAFDTAGNGQVEVPSSGAVEVIIRDPLFGFPICTIDVPGDQEIDGSFDQQNQQLHFDGEDLEVSVSGPDSLCPNEEDGGSLEASYQVDSAEDITIVEP